MAAITVYITLVRLLFVISTIQLIDSSPINTRGIEARKICSMRRLPNVTLYHNEQTNTYSKVPIPGANSTLVTEMNVCEPAGSLEIVRYAKKIVCEQLYILLGNPSSSLKLEVWCSARRK